jgi:asparagine synthase (glutamine-hydrolysing)
MTVLVLPDAPVPRALLDEAGKHVPAVLFRHPSGRPWILADDAVSSIGGGNGKIDVAVVAGAGTTLAPATLNGPLRRRESVAELDAEAAGIAEADVLFFAREPGRMRCQAPLFLTRSLCWTTVDGIPLISDSQVTLKEIARLDPDPAVLAGRLTDAELSHVYGLRSIWRGVRTVGSGEWLDSREAATPERVRWWRPPAADRPVDDLAGELREAIRAALARRTAGHPEVSGDLSGGLDSTTLDFFLADLGVKPHTLFLASANVANQDRVWAERAAGELGARHRSVPYSSVIPYLLDERTGTVRHAPEGPSIANAALASVPMIEDLMADTGSTLHLNGHAGDALFGTVSTMLWSLFHSRTRQRYRRTWHSRVLNRYPIGATARMLLRTGPYERDLRRIASHDFATREDDVAAHSRWVPLPQVHPALSDQAREHLRQIAADAVLDGAGSFSPDRTVHQIVEYLGVHGNVVRRMNQAARPSSGLAFDSPYLDRRTAELSMSLCIGDRTHQYPAKPLLAAARPPGMALDYFTRPDKGDYTAEVFAQHQAMKPVLRKLFADGSALGELGLIDEDRLRRMVGRYETKGGAQTDLDNIAFAERWLRSLA